MTVKVVVTGSYRDQEQRQFNFVPGQKDLFEQTAKRIGRKLAEEKFTLLVSWSDANPDSQIDMRRSDQPNHPYWQTADFHALNGYLETIQQSPKLIEEGAGVEMTISEKSGRSPRPFGQEIDFYKNITGVTVNEHIPHEQPKLRSLLLKEQASVADVFIVIGGGKATEHALSKAKDRGVLLTLGFVGGASKEAIAELSSDIKGKLIAEVGDLDKSENVDMIIAKLSTLINLITSPSMSSTPSSPPDNENTEDPNNTNQEMPSHGGWLSRPQIPPFVQVLLGVFVIIGILQGFLEITSEGGIRRRQPPPTTQLIPEPLGDSTSDEVKIKVNYVCTWEGPGVTGNAVKLAEVIAKSENGDRIQVSPPRTDRLGQVSFSMNKNDTVEIAVRHPNRNDLTVPMQNVKITESESELKKQRNTVSRDDCVLDKKIN